MAKNPQLWRFSWKNQLSIDDFLQKTRTQWRVWNINGWEKIPMVFFRRLRLERRRGFQ